MKGYHLLFVNETEINFYIITGIQPGCLIKHNESRLSDCFVKEHLPYSLINREGKVIN